MIPTFGLIDVDGDQPESIPIGPLPDMWFSAPPCLYARFPELFSTPKRVRIQALLPFGRVGVYHWICPCIKGFIPALIMRSAPDVGPGQGADLRGVHLLLGIQSQPIKKTHNHYLFLLTEKVRQIGSGSLSEDAGWSPGS